MNETGMNGKANNTAKIWQRLLWKDFMTVRPLVIAILFSIIASPLLVVFVKELGDANRDTTIGLAVMLWILMPNLMALGAPPMLIGTEEETGTMGWLRTLPVRWQQIADCKFVLAAVFVIVSWVMASLSLYVSTRLWPPNGTSLDDFTNALSSWQGIGHSMYFTFLLLICGFITSYLFRSPVGAIVAVVPLISALAFGMSELVDWVLDTRHAMRPGMIEATPWRWTVLICDALIVLLIAFFVQRFLAWRRLMVAEGSVTRHFGGIERVDAYRPPPPPPTAVIGLYRPAPFYAMLWQQWRQVRWYVLGLAGLTVFFVISESMSTHRRIIGFDLEAFAVPVAVLSFLWLGAITFYGDSVRRRCAFFADRGIATKRVWLTRILPTLFPTLGLAMVVWIALKSSSVRDDGAATPIIVSLMMLYAFGQLVSMWTKRPILAFFAAPAYAAITSTWLAWFMASYPQFLNVLIIVPVILMITTLRLTRRWLDGLLDRGFTLRVLGWTGLAVAAPMVIVLGTRWITTPSTMTQWRSRMMAADVQLGKPASGRYESLPMSSAISIGAMEPGFAGEAAVGDDLDERLRKELAAENTVGHSVTFGELRALLWAGLGLEQKPNEAEEEASAGMDMGMDAMGMDAIGMDAMGMGSGSTMTETLRVPKVLIPGPELDARQYLAVEILLKWSRQVYELAAEGKEGLVAVMYVAEPSEREAMRFLETLVANQAWIVDQDRFATWMELVKQIPSNELRRKARRTAVIAEWKAYQQRGWQRDKYTPTMNRFANAWMLDSPVHKFKIETNRADRYVDLFVKRLLEQIDSEQLFRSASNQQAWKNDWLEASLGPFAALETRDFYEKQAKVSAWVESLRFNVEMARRLQSQVR